MKFEEVLPALREGKKLYNSEFHSLLKLDDGSLFDDCNCRFDMNGVLLLSEKWNIVE